MLSREAKKDRNTQFWNAFQKEMRNVKSSNGKGIHWINYPTGVKDVYVRLETDGKATRFCFDLQPKDDGIRSILWEQMTELRKVMEDAMGPAASWIEFDRVIAGRNVSRILWEKMNLNFYDDEDIPMIKQFMKEKLRAFDLFYQEYKEILIALAE
ncbi:MAG: hypothetical protein ACI837_002637 [Crocinitomicaceae bacterium]|jgi:hypothetical protein